jgi:hypothetical protein
MDMNTEEDSSYPTHKQLMIGGDALKKLGNNRHTPDTDYLVYAPGKPLFYSDREAKTDYVNAAGGNEFFAEVWRMEEKNIGEMASPAALLALRAYALVQHIQSHNFPKADDCEHDMRFLIRSFNLSLPAVVKKYVDDDGWKEIEQVFQSMRR